MIRSGSRSSSAASPGRPPPPPPPPPFSHRRHCQATPFQNRRCLPSRRPPTSTAATPGPDAVAAHPPVGAATSLRPPSPPSPASSPEPRSRCSPCRRTPATASRSPRRCSNPRARLLRLHPQPVHLQLPCRAAPPRNPRFRPRTGSGADLNRVRFSVRMGLSRWAI